MKTPSAGCRTKTCECPGRHDRQRHFTFAASAGDPKIKHSFDDSPYQLQILLPLSVSCASYHA